MLQRGWKNDHFVSCLRKIWSVAGHEKEWRDRNAKEKFKRSPNHRVGLPRFSTVRSVAEQFFEDCKRVEL